MTNHSKLVQTRRRLQRARKVLAGTVKREKKLRNRDARKAGAHAPKAA